MAEHGESENHHGPTGEAAAASARVFISYASHDAEMAQMVCSALEAAGLPCWLAPRDVKPGAQYADAIVRAINEAKAVVLVLSGSAVGSSHVGREVERAASKRKPIIPFRLDSAALNPELEYFLSNSQWIEVPKLGVPAALGKLKQAVGQESPTMPQDVTAGNPPSRAKNRVAIAATAVVVGLGIAIGLGVYFWSSKHGVPPAPAVAAIVDKSIAVLPFVDMSEKKDQEYFADGMAEEIIDLLAQIPGLKVIGRTSSFQFRAQTQDLRTIGAKLGVAYVLEGSVRKSGDRVRVTAQLIDVSDGAHRWSGTYDRDVVDVLKVQDEISLGLVRALQVSMGADEPGSRPTLKSVEGYSLYLRGRLAFDQYDKAGYDQAASYFRRAMELDPESALAPASLAFVHFTLAAYGLVQPDTAFEDARRYAERALSLDPRSALAMAALGVVEIWHDWDWVAGAAELDHALALAPGNARILALHSYATWASGQWDTSIRDLNAAVALDPLYPGGYYLLGINQLAAGYWGEAETAFKRALDIAPNYALLHFQLAKALLFKGEKQAALQEIRMESNEAPQWIGLAAISYALGRKADSDAALERLMRNYPDRAIGVAQIYAARGESDAAFIALERAFTHKEYRLWGVKGEPYFNTLKGDPRYKAFLKKLNLPE
jgi:TolB-like protein/tetratricopeptide (TPR) repeat protein